MQCHCLQLLDPLTFCTSCQGLHLNMHGEIAPMHVSQVSWKEGSSAQEPSVLEIHNALACDLEAGLSLR